MIKTTKAAATKSIKDARESKRYSDVERQMVPQGKGVVL